MSCLKVQKLTFDFWLSAFLESKIRATEDHCKNSDVSQMRPLMELSDNEFKPKGIGNPLLPLPSRTGICNVLLDRFASGWVW